MALNLNIDASSEEQQEYQRLLLERRRLDERLASLHHHRSSINKHRRQSSNNVPRSFSSTGVPVPSKHHSDRVDTSSTMRRAISQRSAPPMARNHSRGSSQRFGNMSSTSNRSAPAQLLESRCSTSTTSAWPMQDQFPNEYTFTHQPPPFQQALQLEEVPEMEDPSDFLLRNQHESFSSLSSTTPFNSQRLSTGSSYQLQIPTTPTTASLTSATTFTTLSRTSSLCNEALLEELQMLRCRSNLSNVMDDDQCMSDQISPSISSLPIYRSSDEEQSLILTGTGGASQFSQASFPILPSSESGEKMEKSRSNESTSSSLSSSRNIKRLQEQNSSAIARPLMPKGGSEEGSQSDSAQSLSRVASNTASDKIAISKPTYTRPKHDRVFCKKCEAHPEGFRGEHELRRHQDREHKKMVKKFICVEPVDGRSHPRPILPLAKCKACNQQKKKYNAYYNAAAHLRRAHFKPRLPKGKSKQSRPNNDEKRGGSGGGDWPDMKELKFWMREVEETAFPLSDAEQEDADASDGEDSFDALDAYESSQQSISIRNVDASAFSNIDLTTIDFESVVGLNNYGMQVPLDLACAPVSHYMDSSMHTDQAHVHSPYASFQNGPAMGSFADNILPTFSVEQDLFNMFPSDSFHQG